MKNRLEQKEGGQQDVCPACDCQMKKLHSLRLVKYSDLSDNINEDLSVHLTDAGQRRRYEEVRNFRDIHGYPKWSEQWRAQQHSADPCQNIS